MSQRSSGVHAAFEVCSSLSVLMAAQMYLMLQMDITRGWLSSNAMGIPLGRLYKQLMQHNAEALEAVVIQDD